MNSARGCVALSSTNTSIARTICSEEIVDIDEPQRVSS